MCRCCRSRNPPSMMTMIETHSVLRQLGILLLSAMCPLAVAQDTHDGSAAVTDTDGATIGRMGEPAGVDPNKFKFSEAESRLWMSDHLKNVTRPARLYYQFTKAGSLEEGFSDSVYLDVLKLNSDGTKDANLHFLTGEREQAFTPENVTSIRGNPVLGVYLRGDVLDMNRLTQGNWRYFQRLIKAAFADGAVVEPVTVTFEGRNVTAERIRITPYIHDARRTQYEQFEGKRYEFLLSDDIPGTLYQIHTVVPGPTDKDKPLLEETLTLQRVEFRS